MNGREKKIAIVENERVTEFYIERGSEDQGIVGNLYKGRVMRVLPGMQSAFVDIGLERDAFLYVSDFFDEEAEFERIVVDTAKKGDAATAQQTAAEHIEQSRIERERHIEASQRRAEPLRELEGADIAIAGVETSAIPAAVPEEEPSREAEKRRRGRRGGRRGRPEKSETPPAETEAIETPFISAAGSFERISDDEERITNGEMFKDARLQERLTDEVHAREFDFDNLADARVGSLLPTAPEASASFERVDDGESESGVRAGRKPEVVAAHVRDFADEVADESSRGPSFQRVSDDEELAAQRTETVVAPATRRAAPKKEPASRKKTGVISRFFKTLTEPETPAEPETSAEDVPDAEASITTGRPHEEFATRRGGRRRRRPNKKPTDGIEGNDASSPAETIDSIDSPDLPEPIEAQAAPEVVAEAPAAAEETPQAAAPREGRRPSPSPRGGRRPARREHKQPMITDLLKEGQEILVQIAKEPIAKKGARITSHIALPGRYLVYMPTVEHLGVSRKIDSESERTRLRKLIQKIHADEKVTAGGFIVRTAGVGISEADLRADAAYLVRAWQDIRRDAEKAKAPSLVHRDLDLVQRILRDQLSEDFTAIRIDSEEEYQRVVEFVNRMYPRMVKRVKLYTRDEPILEAFGVQAEIDKAIKPRVWLRSGGYLVINQTEALVSIDVNTGKFVGRGATRLEDTITRTNIEAVEEIARQIRLRDLGGIIVLDLIDMEERRNRQRVMTVLQDALHHDKSPTKVLSFNDFGLVIMTRKRVKQSLERTLCAPCSYCQGAGLVKSPQTVCYEILEQARRLSRENAGDGSRQAMLRVNPEIARALRATERDVLNEIEDYLGAVDLSSDPRVHQEQFDFAFV